MVNRHNIYICYVFMFLSHMSLPNTVFLNCCMRCSHLNPASYTWPWEAFSFLPSGNSHRDGCTEYQQIVSRLIMPIIFFVLKVSFATVDMK